MCYEHTSLDRTRKESYCTRMVLSAAWALSAAWRGPLSNDLTLTCTRKQRTGGEARGALLRRARLHLYVSLESMSTGDHARPPAGPRAYPRVRRSSLACRRSRCRRCCPPFARLGSGGGARGRRAPLLAWRWRRERGDERRPVKPLSDREPASAVATAAEREGAAHAARDDRGAAEHDAYARVPRHDHRARTAACAAGAEGRRGLGWPRQPRKPKG